MEYIPKALPPTAQLSEIFAGMQAGQCKLAFIVGSAVRDADHGIEPDAYSVFAMPPRGVPVDTTVKNIREAMSPGTRLGRIVPGETSRYEFRMGSGPLLRLTMCHRPVQMQPDSMANNSVVNFSGIVMDVFTGTVHAGSPYRMDRREESITLKEMSGLPIAQSIQKNKYPNHTIIGVNGRPIERTSASVSSQLTV